MKKYIPIIIFILGNAIMLQLLDMSSDNTDGIVMYGAVIITGISVSLNSRNNFKKSLDDAVDRLNEKLKSGYYDNVVDIDKFKKDLGNITKEIK